MTKSCHPNRPPRERPTRLPLLAVMMLGFGGLVALAVAVVFAVGFSVAKTSTTVLLQGRADGTIEAIVTLLERELGPIEDQARWLARATQNGSFNPRARASIEPFLQGLLASSPRLGDLAIVGVDGNAQVLERGSDHVEALPWASWHDVGRFVTEAKNDTGPVWAAPYYHDDGVGTRINVRTPLFHEGAYLGFLWQGVRVSHLSSALPRVSPEGTELTPFILYDQNWVLAHPMLADDTIAANRSAPLPDARTFQDTVIAALWGPKAKALPEYDTNSGTAVVEVKHEDGEYVVLYRELSGFTDKPITVGAYFDVDAADASDLNRLRWLLVVGFLVLGAAILAAYIVSRTVSRPVMALTTAMAEVKGRRLDDVPKLKAQRILEIDQARRTFNDMVAGMRERRLMRRLLGIYVPETVARALVEGGGALEPAATEATVLFVDVAGFTPLTERLGPTGIVNLLNEWFETATEILEGKNGVITQFQGDAILCVFNVQVAARDHAADAVAAAVELQKVVGMRLFADERISIRIGVATGSVVAGSVGAEDRRTYTVHGDAVNRAARLEALNKDLGTNILISEATAMRTPSTPLERVGTIDVRGQSEPATVFTIRQTKTNATTGTQAEPQSALQSDTAAEAARRP